MPSVKFANISLLQLSQLEDKDEYHFVFKHSPDFQKAVDHIGIGELHMKPFGMIKDAQESFSAEDTTDAILEYMSEFSGKSVDELLNVGVLEFFQSRNYMTEELAKITEVERITFSRGTTNEEEQAGIDELSKFGVELQIEQLCKGEIWQRDAIRATPYHIAFTWLAMWAARSDFQERLNEIRSKK